MENGISSTRWLRYPLNLVSAAALLVGITTAAVVGTADVKQGEPRVPGELIVKLRQDYSSNPAQVRASLQSTLSKLDGVQITGMKGFRTDDRLVRVKINDDKKLMDAIRVLATNGAVRFAEPNYIYRAINLPNDADFSKLWGLLNEGQADAAGQRGTPGSDIDVVRVWGEGHTGSRDVVVAVIDTGIDWEHPDLVDNLYTNEGEIAGNGVDDDGNGFVDDIHGFDFSQDNHTSDDDHSHGTHCAGTIGGVGNNGIGVAGVSWNVRLLPVKFLTAGGSGTLADAVEAINYSTTMGVNIMSNSWGGGGFSQAMEDSIKAARDAGILFVAAAGNDRGNNNDERPTYPATYQVENVISVAATDNQDNIASFSNLGPRTVHVAAPGVKVWSTVIDGGYEAYSGTSMATPHVAGAAALLWSIHPEWGFAEIKRRLIETSDPVRGLRRKVLAKGRVNVYNALHNIVPPSSEPDESLWQDVPMTFESNHPYQDNLDVSFDISYPGAKYIRVHFERVEMEAGYDFVQLIQTTDGRSEVIESVSGSKTDYMSDYVAGDSAVLKLKSDYSVNGWGFKIDRIQVIME